MLLKRWKHAEVMTTYNVSDSLENAKELFVSYSLDFQAVHIYTF